MMLARNQLTAEQLGIPQKWFAAVVEVRNRLERGELVHCASYCGKETTNGFNMAVWSAHFMVHEECGTVHCIGGWAEKIGGVNFFGSGTQMQMFETNYPALCELLFPACKDEILWETISSDQAAQAITNYLITGDAQWNIVLEL